MSVAEQVTAVRRSVGLFELADRGLIHVTGGDRVLWLNGQVSNDVSQLDPGSPNGCYALLLTPKGAIVADLHVSAYPDSLRLETAAAAIEASLERMQRYIVADDVQLADRSAEFARLAIEGPLAPKLLAEVVGAALELPAESSSDLSIDGVLVQVAAWGFSNLPAYQLCLPVETLGQVRGALLEAGQPLELVAADEEALEILRVESGVPAFGSELDSEVLPAEAHMQHAISTTKGCYTGQEIVERVRSRGQVNHLLVGLEISGVERPSAAAPIELDGKAVGEVTSVVSSPEAGVIALGYVRRSAAEPGTSLRVGSLEAKVCELPFVTRGARA